MDKHHLAILHFHARKAFFRVQDKIPVPYEDCYGEACVIYTQVLNNFNPDKGVKFTTVLYSYLKHLEKQILIANRISSSNAYEYMHPLSIDAPLSGISPNATSLFMGSDCRGMSTVEALPAKDTTIHTEELSREGELVVRLLLERVIGHDYGTGKGKKLPGKKRIIPYMKKAHNWSYRKTEKVIEEITEWWRDIS